MSVALTRNISYLLRKSLKIKSAVFEMYPLTRRETEKEAWAHCVGVIGTSNRILNRKRRAACTSCVHCEDGSCQQSIIHALNHKDYHLPFIHLLFQNYYIKCQVF